MKRFSCNIATQLIALTCVALIAPGDSILVAQPGGMQPQPLAAGDPPPLSAAELESLVAPIALYPDQLLAQTLAAATYPLEIVEAARWVKSNPSLKGDSLVKAAAQQNWEPSVQALVIFPNLLNLLSENLTWTTALGNAFLAQQEDTMSAVQRLRAKAEASGALKSTSQQTVVNEQINGTNAIVIQPANPEVVYVPAYDPVAIFGPAPYYAYPSLTYPTAVPSFLAFTSGVVLGSIFGGWYGGGWGWGCHWGPRPSLYVNNTFINRSGFRGATYAGRTGDAAWVHNPMYRGAVPYSNASVANRYGRPGSTGTAARTATPQGTGAPTGSRMPNVATPAVTGMPKGEASRIANPNGTGTRGTPPGLRKPNLATPPATGMPKGGAGRITTPNANSPVATPKGGASRVATPSVTVPAAPQGTFTNRRPNTSGGSGQTRMNNQPGAGSMGGKGGQGTGRPEGGGRRR
jgi:hypothetical protein